MVDRLTPRITRMAAYYARRCGEDADDLRQEAWIGLLEALSVLDLTIGDPEQYLIRVARWRLLDFVRRARLRRCDSLDDMPEFLHGSSAPMSPAMASSVGFVPASAPPSSQAVIAGVDFDDFLERLDHTPRRILKYLMEGLTWREAATEMGCTSANVAYHVRRLRHSYAAWNEE